MTYEEAERIDPGAAWDKLPPDAQRALGIAAIVTAVSEHAFTVYDYHDDELPPAALEEALERGREEMHNVVLEHIAPQRDSTRLLAIDTAAIGFPSCHQCGCTETNACIYGCTWVDETRTLCTACASLRCEPVAGQGA